LVSHYFLNKNKIFIFLSVIVVLIISVYFSLYAQEKNKSGVIFRMNYDILIGKNEVTETVISFNGEIDIEGKVAGSVISFGKPVYVKGAVGEDVVVFGSDIILTEGSMIKKDAVTIGGEVMQSYNSTIDGNITEMNKISGWQIRRFLRGLPYHYHRFFNSIDFLLPSGYIFFRIIGMLVIAAIIVAFLPKHITTIAQSIREKPWKSLFIGLLGSVFLIPVIIFLGITIIGIPLIPIFIILLLIAGLIGGVSIYYLVGNRMLSAFNAGDAAVVWSVFAGLIILEIFKMIPLIGMIIFPILYLLGLGSVVLTRFGSRML